jgi:hypothetical protein
MMSAARLQSCGRASTYDNDRLLEKLEIGIDFSKPGVLQTVSSATIGALLASVFCRH